MNSNKKIILFQTKEIIILFIFYLISNIYIYYINKDTKFLKTVVSRESVYQSNYCSGNNAINRITLGSNKIFYELAQKTITEISIFEDQKIMNINANDEIVEIKLQLKGKNIGDIKNYEKLIDLNFRKYYMTQFKIIYEDIKLHCSLKSYSMYKVGNTSMILSSKIEYKYTALKLMFLGSLPTLILLLSLFLYRNIKNRD